MEGPVGHANAVPIEYLYIEVDHRFYFLELNPRLHERRMAKVTDFDILTYLTNYLIKGRASRDRNDDEIKSSYFPTSGYKILCRSFDVSGNNMTNFEYNFKS